MRWGLLIILLALPAAAPSGQEDALAEAWRTLDRFVETRMKEAGTPGLALAVTDRDRLLHVAAYGLADLGARTPVTADTRFQIGSISKSFTSIALLQLHEEGRFDPQAPIDRYLPWFSIKTRHAPVTGHHLMSHTAGFPRDRDDVPSSPYQAYGVRDRETGYPPGTHYAYSNVGYQVLGYAVEAIAKEPYPEVIRRRILEPLGMRASAAQFTHADRPRLAVGYESMYDDRPHHVSYPLVPAPWLEYAAGDGSIVSTPADMAAYARMWLNRGRGPNGRILSEKSFALLTQRAIATGKTAWYGYGVGTSERDGRVRLQHSGGMVGYSSMIVVEPETGLGAVAFVNGPGDPGAVARFALDVAGAARGGQPLPQVPPAAEPRRVEKASEYAGTYTSETGAVLRLVADGTGLLLKSGDVTMPLESMGDDLFFANHPEFARFPLRVERRGDAVAAVSHGARWYAAGTATPPSKPHPPEWDAYPGHYRTTHPWFNNFRIVVRRGTLYLVGPGGNETTLEPIGPGVFKEAGESAERIRFDSLVEGQALRADLSGVAYYRVFTP